jgi:hypothetical protein
MPDTLGGGKLAFGVAGLFGGQSGGQSGMERAGIPGAMGAEKSIAGLSGAVG